MKTIWKQELLIIGTTTFDAPDQAAPLTIGMQGDKLFLWFITRTENSPQTRSYKVIGTGHEVPERGMYVGTVQHEDGMVWHAFQLAPEPETHDRPGAATMGFTPDITEEKPADRTDEILAALEKNFQQLNSLTFIVSKAFEHFRDK